MTAGVLIRSATEEDARFVEGLVPALLEFGSPAWNDRDAMAAGYRRALRGAVEACGGDSTVLIAEARDGSPVGFISLTTRRVAGGEFRAHVADLAVTHGVRRTGVGTALMKAAELWASQHGHHSIDLDVWEPNTQALAFYRELGYVADSRSLLKAID